MSNKSKFAMSFKYEIDKPANEYTEEEIELLKKEFMASDTRKCSYLTSRRNRSFGDGYELVDKIYESMTQEEKIKMLRRKWRENQPVLEEIKD